MFTVPQSPSGVTQFWLNAQMQFSIIILNKKRKSALWHYFPPKRGRQSNSIQLHFHSQPLFNCGRWVSAKALVSLEKRPDTEGAQRESSFCFAIQKVKPLTFHLATEHPAAQYSSTWSCHQSHRAIQRNKGMAVKIYLHNFNSGLWVWVARHVDVYYKYSLQS